MSVINYSQDYYDIAAQLLAQAKARGASDAEVSIDVSRQIHINSRNFDTENLEHCHDVSLELTVFNGDKQASVSGTKVQPQDLVLLVDKAMSLLQFAQSDPLIGLADRNQLAYEYPQLEIYFPRDVSLEGLQEQLIAAERVGCDLDSRIKQSNGCSFSTSNNFTLYANSRDFIGSYQDSDYSFVASYIAQSDGQMQRHYESQACCDFNDLLPFEQLSAKAAQGALDHLGAKQIKTQKCPVVFNNKMAKSILSHLCSAISGVKQYRQSSFLLGQLNKMIVPDWVNLYQRPHLAKGMGSAPFDSEGLKTSDRYFIEHGRLKSYITSLYSARKLKVEPTGTANGVHNLFIEPTDADLNALLKQMGTGLLVTDLMGQGVNVTTGDYSRGAAGFWVEHGEIQFPVEEITIAGNLKDMLKNLAGVGADQDHNGNIHAGSLLIEEMSVAGM